jgi:hypothetical protein
VFAADTIAITIIRLDGERIARADLLCSGFRPRPSD